MTRIFLAVIVAGALAGCAAAPPPSTADEADAASCTAQADAAFSSEDEDALARTSQTGELFSARPNHVFDAERLGALHERDSQITNCEDEGADAAGAAPAGPSFLQTPVVPPQIITPSNGATP
jgi:hypothetical protein